MLNLSYNISFELKKSLDTIDALRAKILLSSISPKYEQKLKWDLLTKRLHYTFLLKGQNFDNDAIVKLITTSLKTGGTRAQQQLIFYRRALNYLNEEWIANPSLITVKIIRALSNMISFDVERNISHFRRSEEALKFLLEYLQSQSDHPVVLAAIAYVKILDIAPSVQNNDLLASLCANIFLYKYGFDVKTLISFEEFWYRNLSTYNEVMNEALSKGKLTLWLEFFAFTIQHQLTKTAQLISSPPLTKDATNRIWRLTDRQKNILHNLDEPGTQVTNRSVQKTFGISQITASRDLAKLASLGLVITHGKGRSVYYIKA